MKIYDAIADLRALIFFEILGLIALVSLLFALSWNEVAVVVCTILEGLLLIAGVVDLIYFGRRIILDESGCTFVSFWATKKFTWEEVYLQHTNNSSFFFGDSEIPGEGVIISVKPISKPTYIGAMTYCRFTHPSTSVFIRFSSPSDRLIRTSAKFLYRGFVAEKDEILSFLR